MKNIVLLFSIVFLATAVYAQEQQHSNPAGSDKYFIVHYIPGTAWKKDKPANEQEHFKEHSEHLSDLRNHNHIDIGGRYGNTLMLLVRAKSEDEAKSYVEDDPAVKNKLFKTELARSHRFLTDAFDNKTLKNALKTKTNSVFSAILAYF